MAYTSSVSALCGPIAHVPPLCEGRKAVWRYARLCARIRPRLQVVEEDALLRRARIRAARVVERLAGGARGDTLRAANYSVCRSASSPAPCAPRCRGAAARAAQRPSCTRTCGEERGARSRFAARSEPARGSRRGVHVPPLRRAPAGLAREHTDGVRLSAAAVGARAGDDDLVAARWRDPVAVCDARCAERAVDAARAGSTADRTSDHQQGRGRGGGNQ